MEVYRDPLLADPAADDAVDCHLVQDFGCAQQIARLRLGQSVRIFDAVGLGLYGFDLAVAVHDALVSCQVQAADRMVHLDVVHKRLHVFVQDRVLAEVEVLQGCVRREYLAQHAYCFGVAADFVPGQVQQGYGLVVEVGHQRQDVYSIEYVVVQLQLGDFGLLVQEIH
eukprot:CAMPEP_0116950556 /NCGR_PEP_ID=MMETSP0467-20121206/39539_1 /TAXON_ID=283647 /ORGANISM="Mesodinium pulex, Strain SPMC105" /LENGTH=167 /DNA_ID=CAMNT_0004635323 /DNA_START=1588 /DNA_END=2091 /DNA_ORIENTATION=+